MSDVEQSLPYVHDWWFDAVSATFRVLETFDEVATGAWEPLRCDIRGKVYRALQDYPELAGRTVTVGRLDPDRDDLSGQAWPHNDLIMFHADRPTSFQAVYHELGHLAIHALDRRGEDVPPTSEEFCSIFSVARMPPHLVNRDTIAYIGEPSVPSHEWPDICRRALGYRDENGAGSHYVKRCRGWLGVG